jgi:hypothetical protein
VTFEPSSKSHGEEWEDDLLAVPGPEIIAHLMKEPVPKVHLDELCEKTFNAFSELYHTDEFQTADTFRQENFLAVK